MFGQYTVGATVGHHTVEGIADVAVHLGVDVNSVVGGSVFEVFPRINVWAYTEILLSTFLAFGGTLALTSLLRWFGATLYATKGGSGKTSFSFGSCDVIDLQCLLPILVMEGSRVSYWMTQIGLWFASFLLTFLMASNLGIFLPFSNAVFTTPGLYPLD